MSFHVSAWSIKNPVPTLMAFIILSIVGLYSFFNLGIDNTPNVDVSAVIINVSQPGAAPEEIETEITKKIDLFNFFLVSTPIQELIVTRLFVHDLTRQRMKNYILANYAKKGVIL